MLLEHNYVYRQYSQPKIHHHPPTTNDLRKKIEHYSFNLSDRIGKGYSSIVYKGTNDLTKQTVAIKVIDLKSIKDNILKSLLDTEIHCIKLLSHQSILKCYDTFMTVNNCYIVTEFCEGGDLAQQLKRRKRFTERQVMKFYQEFYDGYQHLIKTGYIHRDIKPANIFFKNSMIKIADFGFVKLISQNPQQSYNVGTALYMSPQAMFKNMYSQKSDIWAMGIMLYELIHGKTPWRGLVEKDIKLQIESANIQFDDQLISNELKSFIQCCLKRNINQRISLNQMLQHPWIKKISQIQPKVNHRLSCGNHISRSIEYEKYRNKSERTTLESKKQESKQNNFLNVNGSKGINNANAQCLAKYVQKNQKNYQNILQSLISILNYLRYQYRLYKMLHRTQYQQCFSLRIALVSDLAKGIQVHQKMIDEKSNVFKLSNWEKFIKSSKWPIYSDVVQQYSQRYHKVYKKQIKNTNSGQNFLFIVIIKQTIQNLFNSLSKDNSNDKYQKLQIIDYLITLLQFTILINEQGWMKFIENSKINQIIQSKCVIDQANYQQIYQQVRKKIAIII